MFLLIILCFKIFQSQSEDKKAGILRVESNIAATSNLPGSNTNSTGSNRRKSSPFRKSSLVAQEAISPAPSADRLSVTFAMDDGTNIQKEILLHVLLNMMNIDS